MFRSVSDFGSGNAAVTVEVGSGVAGRLRKGKYLFIVVVVGSLRNMEGVFTTTIGSIKKNGTYSVIQSAINSAEDRKSFPADIILT
jgi:hypothetical protein